MIVNNYNNEIRENKATDLNFYNPYSPQLFIRQFPCRVNYNEKLIIPYYVNPYTINLNVTEEADESNNFVGKYCDGLNFTYTTILQLDCDLPNPPEDMCFKHSTFEGDGCFEIGPFPKSYVGEHTFSIEAIQNDGMTSKRQYFKFLIDDPEEVVTQVTLNRAFTGTYDGTVFIRHQMLNTSGGYIPVKKEILNAKYTVTPYKGSDGKCERINIKITKANTSSSVNPSIKYTRISAINDDGTPTYSTSDSNIFTVDISGEYNLTTYYSDGTNKFNLIDYIDKQPIYYKEVQIGDKVDNQYQFDYYTGPNYTGSQIEGILSTNYNIPEGVQDAAVKNKEALIKLIEAAAGKDRSNRKTRLILPKDMSIVTSYDVPTERYTNLYSGFQFELPNYFTLDMNGSTIYTLPSVNKSSGGVVGIDFAFDTHICNGHIYGNYKYIQYENQKISSIKPQKTNINRVYPEWLGISSISDSKFCTYENVEFAYATGYDAFIGAGESVSRYSFRSYKSEYCSRYLSTGFIGYDGNFQEIKHLNYSMRGTGDSIPEISPEALKTFYVMRSNINSTEDEVGDRAAFPDARNLICGNTYTLSKIDGASTGLRHKSNKSHFIHFYDKNKNFIKTVKIDDSDINVYPRNAKYAVLSAFGHLSYNKNAIDLDCLTNKSSAALGSPMVDLHGYSWCCGYDNCIFKDFRTSILDNKNGNQCFMQNCYMWELATERYRGDQEGGYSNQQQFIDLEDGSVSNINFSIKNCENIYGYGRYGAKVHISHNLLIDKSRNINYVLCKGNCGGTVENSVLRGLTFGQGFSNKTRYEIVRNCDIGTLKNVYDSGVFAVGDCDLEVFVKDSTINNVINEDLHGSKDRIFPVYLNNCNKLK